MIHITEKLTFNAIYFNILSKNININYEYYTYVENLNREFFFIT